jgi:hypothetical protein
MYCVVKVLEKERISVPAYPPLACLRVLLDGVNVYLQEVKAERRFGISAGVAVCGFDRPVELLVFFLKVEVMWHVTGFCNVSTAVKYEFVMNT